MNVYRALDHRKDFFNETPEYEASSHLGNDCRHAWWETKAPCDQREQSPGEKGGPPRRSSGPGEETRVGSMRAERDPASPGRQQATPRRVAHRCGRHGPERSPESKCLLSVAGMQRPHERFGASRRRPKTSATCVAPEPVGVAQQDPLTKDNTCKGQQLIFGALGP